MLYSCPAGRKVGTPVTGKKKEEEIEIDDRQAAMILEQALKLGATGKFPDGKVSPDDEGELKLGVTHKDKNVVIVFGRPVAWLSMATGVARDLARAMLEHADKVDQEAGEKKE